jgi:hypothetical protein
MLHDARLRIAEYPRIFLWLTDENVFFVLFGGLKKEGKFWP